MALKTRSHQLVQEQTTETTQSLRTNLTLSGTKQELTRQNHSVASKPKSSLSISFLLILRIRIVALSINGIKKLSQTPRTP